MIDAQLAEVRETLSLMREADIDALHAWMKSPGREPAEAVFAGPTLELARRIEANKLAEVRETLSLCPHVFTTAAYTCDRCGATREQIDDENELAKLEAERRKKQRMRSGLS